MSPNLAWSELLQEFTSLIVPHTHSLVHQLFFWTSVCAGDPARFIPRNLLFTIFVIVLIKLVSRSLNITQSNVYTTHFQYHIIYYKCILDGIMYISDQSKLTNAKPEIHFCNLEFAWNSNISWNYFVLLKRF